MNLGTFLISRKARERKDYQSSRKNHRGKNFTFENLRALMCSDKSLYQPPPFTPVLKSGPNSPSNNNICMAVLLLFMFKIPVIA